MLSIKFLFTINSLEIIIIIMTPSIISNKRVYVKSKIL